MTPPPIQALGATQEWSGTSWKATGFVEGIGRLAALQALAAQRVAEGREAEKP